MMLFRKSILFTVSTFISILMLVGFCAPASAESDISEVIVLEPPAAESQSESMLPFTHEYSADVIAFGKMGKHFRLKGQELVRLHITKVLKGTIEKISVETEDKLPFFGCIMPEGPLPKPSDLYSEETRVIVYLNKHDGNWHLRALSKIEPEMEVFYEKRIRRFVAFADASLSENPTERYRELLSSDKGGLDKVAYTALQWFYYNPAVYPVLLEHFKETVDILKNTKTDKPLSRHYTKLIQLAYLLEKSKDERSIRLLLEALPHLPDQIRFQIYDIVIRDLDQSVSEKTLGQVRDILIEELGNVSSSENQRSYRQVLFALGNIADERTIDVLMKEQTRQFKSGLSEYPVIALSFACNRTGRAGCKRIKEKWLDILNNFRPSRTPNGREMTFIRHILSKLYYAGIDKNAKAQLIEIRDRHYQRWYNKGWFYKELDGYIESLK